MRLFRIFMTPLLVALGLGLQACTTAPMSEYQADEQRASIRQMANETIAQLYQQYPAARRQMQRSAGYAVFSNFGLKVLFMGSATGEGLAVNHATRRETFMRMVELQPGYGFGVQRFRLVFVFETPQAFDQFVDSGWEFGANAMASAQTRTQQMGNQLGVSVSPGVLMYQLSDQGAIVGVSITGAKYYPDPNLN
ncbi:MAG TPA: YSC84-related protein [Candidatus Competibacteraceae bacterium]|nr:YSC84-related protein [Candidatus Competibacteraceae bacterium]HRZ08179.1 YSC84-related protein [Candidatus Competibacteraceae bacterium]HSA48265.1 YSC84-related protein [Candidatus Competibacteraceae bacterium]